MIDELYHRAKFCEDCTVRAGCRFENNVCHYVFSLSRSEPGALFVRGEQEFVRTKSHIGSKLSQIFLGICIQEGL